MPEFTVGSRRVKTLGLQAGPIEPYVDSFVERLERLGYHHYSIRSQLDVVAHLGRWMERSQITIEILTEDTAKHFIARRPKYRHRSTNAYAAVRHLLSMLNERGVTRPPSPATQHPDNSGLARLRRDYETFLKQERGLTDESVINCWYVAKRFLTACFGDGGIRLEKITASDIGTFVSGIASRSSKRRTQTDASLLRAFLRFLLQRGLIETDLSASVPTVAGWAKASLPRYLAAADVDRLVNAPDLSKAIGRRDHAVLLLMARVGLRGTEVVALQLDDVDWRAGELLIRGKGKQHERMPLPCDVGAALAEYLRRDRGGPTRSLFVRVRAPRTGFVDAQPVNAIVKRAARRAGIVMPARYVGSHILRHSLATNMLRGGASMAEIGELLRHRSSMTTAIYAKVDIEGLRSIAQPWPSPGGA